MTYTEEEIKAWFNNMKHKYPNSNILNHLESIEFMMFDKYSNDNLKEIKEEKG